MQGIRALPYGLVRTVVRPRGVPCCRRWDTFTELSRKPLSTERKTSNMEVPDVMPKVKRPQTTGTAEEASTSSELPEKRKKKPRKIPTEPQDHDASHISIRSWSVLDTQVPELPWRAKPKKEMPQTPHRRQAATSSRRPKQTLGSEMKQLSRDPSTVLKQAPARSPSNQVRKPLYQIRKLLSDKPYRGNTRAVWHYWGELCRMQNGKGLIHMTEQEFIAITAFLDFLGPGQTEFARSGIQVLSVMSKLGYTPSETMIVRVLSACARLGMVTEVEQLHALLQLAEEEAQGVPLLGKRSITRKASYLATAHAAAGDLIAAEAAIRHVHAADLFPIAHLAFVKAYASRGDEQQMLRHFDLMKAHRRLHVLNSRADRGPGPRQMWQDASATIVRYYATQEPIDKDAVHPHLSYYLEHFQRDSYWPQAISDAVEAILNAGHWHLAKSYWEKSNPSSRNALIGLKIAAAQGHAEEAWSLLWEHFTKHNKSDVLSTVTKDICKVVAGAQGPVAHVKALRTTLVAANVPWTPQTAFVALRGYCDMGDSASAAAILAGMDESVFSNVAAYTQLLKLYAATGKLGPMHALLRSMHKRGWRIDWTVYVSVLNRLILTHSMKGVDQILDAIERNAVVFPVKTLERMRTTMREYPLMYRVVRSLSYRGPSVHESGHIVVKREGEGGKESSHSFEEASLRRLPPEDSRPRANYGGGPSTRPESRRDPVTPRLETTSSGSMYAEALSGVHKAQTATSNEEVEPSQATS
ncbi:hypothetical protein DFJ77DRAFT_189914 [Powellomyces hirtus]|nr:hypothetical protein DFJ77DRAFT_189914 [Powellomyces hirtus]